MVNEVWSYFSSIRSFCGSIQVRVAFSPKLSAQISTFEMMTRGIRVFTLSCVGSKERNKLFPPT